MTGKTFLLRALALSCAAFYASALSLAGKPNQVIQPYKRNEPLQSIVTWDEHSLFVHGERVFIFSGEFHPFRLPVPGLWLDIFQKIKALGFNGVSFYADWALLEPSPGNFTADGIFSFEPFFEAASQAGIWLLARPGPYINAEVSGGGYPGWMQDISGILRTNQSGYEDATNNYAKNIGEIIAKAQITNGGPVILAQPENEYSQALPNILFPDYKYFHFVEQQLRDAGIVVPLISNDASPQGLFAPPNSPDNSSVDIYGYDAYPLGFDCANPYNWPDGDLPTDFRTLHVKQSPTTPNSIVEFQGGSFDPWGGPGFAKCEILLNDQFERVFFKNDFSFGVTFFNTYMVFGGTNWGNLGHPGGYTSYDYGAPIAEDQTLTREKYSEAKLIANFFMVSPAFLTATPGTLTTSSYTNNSAITVTPLFGNGTKTNFFVIRQSAYNTYDSNNYTLTVPTSAGNFTLPQLGGQLSLNGRDSKISVTDYAVNTSNLLYSTAEVFTWKVSNGRTVLVVYGGPGEQHELAVSGAPTAHQISGPAATIATRKNATVINWQTSSQRRIVTLGSNLFVYLIDRNSAYNYWTVSGGMGKMDASLIINAGYLIRNATVSGSTLSIVGDVNRTTPLEIISGAPAKLKTLNFNGRPLSFKQDQYSVVTAQIPYTAPQLSIPNLSTLTWQYLDSLPEIQASYDDSKWPKANLTSSPNFQWPLMTPTSLYGSDYGFNTGNVLLRGHFTATGKETTVSITTQGGDAFGSSVWLNNTLLGSWGGNPADDSYNATYTLPTLQSGKAYVLTVVIDNMGLNEDNSAGDSGMKDPRGILDYSLSGHSQSDITWKLTGNLGGEANIDPARGPLNAGGFYAERQGYYLPDAPVSKWNASKPTTGISSAGIGFYYTSFTLNMPVGYQTPLSIQLTNSTANSTGTVSQYRVQLYVNGYQFGKYVNNIGPQVSYPVPEGIWNYHGTNYLALTLWAQDATGAKIDEISLVPGVPVLSGYGSVELSPMPAYAPRPEAY